MKERVIIRVLTYRGDPSHIQKMFDQKNSVRGRHVNPNYVIDEHILSDFTYEVEDLAVKLAEEAAIAESEEDAELEYVRNRAKQRPLREVIKTHYVGDNCEGGHK